MKQNAPSYKEHRGRYSRIERKRLELDPVSLTKQEFKEECDVNNILRKFQKYGQLPDLIKKNPQYGDFSQVPTYQDAMNVVVTAQAQFDALPSQVRRRFNNDPAQFLEFATNAANADELVKMRLATKTIKEDLTPGGASAPATGQVAKAGTEPASATK